MILLEENSSQFGNCSDFTAKQLLALNLFHGLSGAVCCLISCVITLLLLISKSYHTVLQRLLLYLMLATAARELFIAAFIEHQFQYSESVQDTVLHMDCLPLQLDEHFVLCLHCRYHGLPVHSCLVHGQRQHDSTGLAVEASAKTT